MLSACVKNTNQGGAPPRPTPKPGGAPPHPTSQTGWGSAPTQPPKPRLTWAEPKSFCYAKAKPKELGLLLRKRTWALPKSVGVWEVGRGGADGHHGWMDGCHPSPVGSNRPGTFNNEKVQAFSPAPSAPPSGPETRSHSTRALSVGSGLMDVNSRNGADHLVDAHRLGIWHRDQPTTLHGWYIAVSSAQEVRRKGLV